MSVRSMLARVAKLERIGQPQLSPFERAYGSLEAFEADIQAKIAAGSLDSIDMPVVMACVRRWHSEGLWGAWERIRTWEFGR